MLKVLIIEDDANVVEAVSLCLQLRWPGASMLSAYEGCKGVELARAEAIDIILLDINLPDISGFDVLAQIRSFSNVPIIILTVREAEDDQTRGLESGADDYIIKPFRPRELVARVNSVLRRYGTYQGNFRQPIVAHGETVLDLARGNLRMGDRILVLTPVEARIVYLLLNCAGQTVSTDDLLREVWRTGSKNSELLRTHIRRIRDKLGDRPPRIIINERGKGYRFVVPQHHI